MVAEFGSHDWRDRRVRDGSLLLLRFAVTREATDQVAALALADQLDSLGIGWKRAKPGFFVKTNIEVSNAILALRMGKTTLCSEGTSRASMTLDLRRAFRAAVGLNDASETGQGSGEPKGEMHPDLWKGLSTK